MRYILTKTLLTLILSASMGFSVFSCGNPSSTDTTSNKQIGEKVDAKFVLDFLPTFVAGMKYTYISKSKKGQVELSELTTAEVIESNGEKSQIRLTIGTNSSVVPVDLSKPPVLPPSGISYEGKETVTVPAGTFNTTKISFSISGGSSFNIWLLKDTGIIKVLEQKNNGDTITTELKEFKK
jgi:hypothetical protein